MATRDEVYSVFGKMAELAQLVETELGTALISYDMFQSDGKPLVDIEEYRRLEEEVNRRTLGSTLRSIKERLGMEGDLESLFRDALKTRNFLAHSFYRHHGFGIDTDAGRDKMIEQLDELRPRLWEAYVAAGSMAQLMVDLVKHVRGDDPEVSGQANVM